MKPQRSLPGSLWRHPKTGGWYWTVTLPGHKRKSYPMRPSGGRSATRNKAVALQVQRAKWASVSGDAKHVERRKLIDLLDALQQAVTLESTARNGKQVADVARKFIVASKIEEPWEITMGGIHSYLSGLTATQRQDGKSITVPASKGTQTRHRAALSRFCQWLVYSEYLDANPVRNIKPPRQQKRRPRYLTRSMQAAFLRRARQHPYRDGFRFLLATGLRISEMLHLERGCVRGSALVVGETHSTKGYRERNVPLTPAMLRMLRRHEGKRLFQPVSIKLWMDAFPVVTAGLPLFGAIRGVGNYAHLLRSTRAVMWARQGVDLWELMRRLGHESPQTTMRYIDVAAMEDSAV